jgi:segregation and condensation protein B
MMALERIIEAILFASSRPVSLRTLVKKLETFSSEDLHEAVRTLIREYASTDRAVEVTEVSGGFQIRTKPDYREWVKRFARERDGGLTRSVLEALAVVAYKQPVTKRDIDTMRGVDSARAIKQLLERKLIEIGGRVEDHGQKMTFRTTKRFLELYGLNDIGDMPTHRELESLER